MSQHELLLHVRKILDEKDRHLYRKLSEIRFRFSVTERHLSHDQAMGLPYADAAVGELWGQKWSYAWFRTDIRIPPEAAGKRVVIRPDFGSEATVFVNGAVRGAIDLVHKEITLTRSAAVGEPFTVLAEAYAGHGENRPRLGQSWLCVFDEELYQFYIDLECLYSLRQTLDIGSYRAVEIDNGFRELLSVFEPGRGDADRSRDIGKWRAILRPLLEKKNGDSAPLLYLMGQSHLDIAWLWPIEETKRKIARTFSNQLALMEEYPDYVYVQSQPYLYQLLKRHYPELYERVRQAVRERRVIPEGGMWVESDTNLPSGESLIRQILYGKRFFEEEFGVESEMLWLPDVFGYSGNLPQIMRQCGLSCMASVKMFQTYNNVADPFPYNTFIWEGIDGSRVPVHLLDYGEYPIRITPEFLVSQWYDRTQKDEISARLVQFGHGDGGGGANRDDMEFMRRLGDLEGVPRTRHGSPLDFFRDQREKGEFKRKYVGELYYPAHRGTYTTQARIKRGNRRTETLLHDLEFLAAAAASHGKPVPVAKDRLDEWWRRFLLLQFHDILPGTSISRVHEEAVREFGKLEEELQSAIGAVFEAAKDPGRSDELTVLNTTSFHRDEVVQVPEGCEGLVQAGPAQEHEGKRYVRVQIPPYGAVSLTGESREAAELSGSGASVRVTESEMENEYLRIRFDERGELTSVYDKEHEREWLSGNANRFRIYRDHPSDFDAWEIDRRYQAAEVECETAASVRVAASGPLFGMLRVEKKLGDTVIVQNIRLRAGKRMVEFDTEVLWEEKNRLLKVDFPAAVHTREMLSEIQFGYVKRPTHRSRPHDADRFEVHQHRWSALVEANGGCALLNDSKYGISAEDQVMSLTLLRAPTYPDPESDSGRHRFAYAFLVWNGDFYRSPVVKEAYAFNYPVHVRRGGWPSDTENGFVSVDRESIVIDTIKLAEDGSGDIVIRAYESKGGSVRAVFRSALLETMAIAETDALERTTWAELPKEGRKAEVRFKPFELKTLRLYRGKRVYEEGGQEK